MRKLKQILKSIDKIIFPEIYLGIDSLEQNLAKYILDNCDTVLDVGCGLTINSPLLNIAPKLKYVYGIDLFEESIKKNLENKIYNEYKVADARNIGNLFKENSFDCVVATDLLEHLTKEEGIKFINQAKKIAKKKLIIFTPNGFIHQDPYDNNIYQIHKSGWNTKELKKYGFNKIYGINGLKCLRGEEAKIKYKPEKFWFRISLLTNKIVYKFPNYAFQLLAILEK